MFEPSSYDALTTIAVGAVILLTAWLPMILKRLPLSLPIVAMAAGYGVGPLLWSDTVVRAAYRPEVIERLTEFVILIALMGAGLRIKRPLSWRGWVSTLLMIAVAMPLSIFGMAALCWSLAGFSAASAVLIGTALAPTDPVLAAEVQAKPPGEEEGGEVRFVLTSEAGLNDGAAFPFVLLAIGLSTASFQAIWQSWLLSDVLLRILVGGVVGFLAGWCFGLLAFKLPSLELAKTGDGLVAVGVTLVSYGATEMLDGYGFLAVFIAAVTLRATDRGHDFHAAMAEFSEQIERILMVLIMLVFGAALRWGLLAPLGWRDILVGLLFLLLVRPLAGWASLAWSPLPTAAKGLIAFFGIRGLGTIYYLAFAVSRAEFEDAGRIWALSAFVIMCSVVLHGVSSSPVMNWVDRRRARVQKQHVTPDTTKPERATDDDVAGSAADFGGRREPEGS
ncbi:sodium:proton antiporter [Mesorhizobium sp. 8]|nr:sodium:proton antiporter [Mesorhizobium sp. 8]